MTTTNTSISITVNYVQIYCERIFDLLSPSTNSSDLSIRQEEEKGVYIAGVCNVPVKTVADCLKCMQSGNENRAVAATSMNAHSSRSHAIFTIHVERRDTEKEGQGDITFSTLSLVDLAGSERVAKSHVRGTRFNELKSINLSLSGNVQKFV